MSFFDALSESTIGQQRIYSSLDNYDRNARSKSRKEKNAAIGKRTGAVDRNDDIGVEATKPHRRKDAAQFNGGKKTKKYPDDEEDCGEFNVASTLALDDESSSAANKSIVSGNKTTSQIDISDEDDEDNNDNSDEEARGSAIHTDRGTTAIVGKGNRLLKRSGANNPFNASNADEALAKATKRARYQDSGADVGFSYTGGSGNGGTFKRRWGAGAQLLTTAANDLNEGGATSTITVANEDDDYDSANSHILKAARKLGDVWRSRFDDMDNSRRKLTNAAASSSRLHLFKKSACAIDKLGCTIDLTTRRSAYALIARLNIDKVLSEFAFTPDSAEKQCADVRNTVSEIKSTLWRLINFAKEHRLNIPFAEQSFEELRAEFADTSFTAEDAR